MVIENKALAVPPPRSLTKQEPDAKPSLPNGVSGPLWRRVFISTYMRFVSWQNYPWEVPVKQACENMQTIWDEVYSDIPETITPSSVAYSIVSIH